MKKLTCCLLAFLLSSAYLFAQNITSAEYFIDADPGIGNGTSIPVTTGATVSFNVIMPTNSLSPGFHVAGIRVMNSNGKWSLFETRGFYSSALPQSVSNIISAEYYFDTDPGSGNGTTMTITPGATISFTSIIPTGSLTPGFHLIGIRVKNANNKWSLFETRGFYVSPSLQNSSAIVAAEYFYNNDPGFGNGTPININVPGLQYKDSLILPLGALPIGDHIISIRVKNAAGKWSLLQTRRFNVCTKFGAQSAASYAIEGNRVFFTNKSVYADSTKWIFGDNTSDTVKHPIKTYATANNYNVKLISINECTTDTLNIPIIIKGLQHINSNVAGNAGIATITFEGFGFTPSTPVNITNGSATIVPVKTTFINSSRVKASFNFSGITPGIFHAVAVFGGSFDTLKNGLTIEPNIPVDLTVQVTGAGRFSPQWFERNVTINNVGSNDAVLVPMLASVPYFPEIAPGNYNANFTSADLANRISLSDIPLFQRTLNHLSTYGVSPAVMNENIKDTLHKKHIISYYQFKIPAHQNAVHNYVSSNNTIGIANILFARVYNPLMSSATEIGAIESTYLYCYSSFLKHEVEKQLNIKIQETGWNNAFAIAYASLMVSMLQIAQSQLNSNAIVSMPAVFSALLAEMASKPVSGVPANIGGIQFRKIVEGVIHNWSMLDDIADIGADCIDPNTRFTASNEPIQKAGLASNRIARQTASPCPLPDPDSDPYGGVGFGTGTRNRNNANYNPPGGGGSSGGCSVGSRDPNEKYGPGDNGQNKFINNYNKAVFKIEFENVASATASAAYVEIADTIDTDVFDINSVELQSLEWGDSTIVIESNKNKISVLKDLRPTLPNQLRIDAVTDTVHGIISWKFFTVDLLNYQLTRDPDEGFLPPNTNSKKGVGKVTYSINPKTGIALATSLTNKATIIFDNNEPMITPIWEYKIDTLRPVSNVHSLPLYTATTNFTVNWNGVDEHSGIKYYNIYVSVNDSAYKLWQSHVTNTSSGFTGVFGNTYKFISVAFDNAGNIESIPAEPLKTPDAITTLSNDFEVVSIQNGLWSQSSTWSNNKVPADTNDVIIKHNVVVDVNGECKSLKILSPAIVHVNAGKKLDIKKP